MEGDRENMEIEESTSNTGELTSNTEMNSQGTSQRSDSNSLLLDASYVTPEHPLYIPLRAMEDQLRCIEEMVGGVTEPLEAEEDLREVAKVSERFEELMEKNYSPKFMTLRLNFTRLIRGIRRRLYVVVNKKRSVDSLSGSDAGGRFLKLPAMDVPKFSGELEKWSAFKGLFLNLIGDSRLENNDVAKRHFLFQALSGEALSIVENLREETFSECWRLLVQFFDDPFRRAKSHFENLFHDRRKGLSLRKRLIHYRQHTTGLRAAYDELHLDPFEQVVIAHFLDCPDTKKGMRLAWERRVTEKRSDCSLEEFFKFVEQESTSNERAGLLATSSSTRPPLKGAKGHAFLVGQRAKVVTKFCHHCRSKEHYLSNCQEFRALPAIERIKIVPNKKLCAVCFRSNCKGVQKPHDCFMKRLFCNKCKQPHNTLLHIESGKVSDEKLIQNDNFNDLKSQMSAPNILSSSPTGCKQNLDISVPTITLFNENITTSLAPNERKESLLSTAVVQIVVEGQVFEARALLDSGSQFDFVTKRLVERINSAVLDTKYSVTGISSSHIPISKCTSLTIQSCYSKFKITTCCLIVDDIVNTMIPASYFSVDCWNLPNHENLADPYFNIPAEVELLLGLEVFWRVLGNRRIKLGAGMPYLQETEFGPIIAGSMNSKKVCNGVGVFFSVKQNTDELMDEIRKFWLVEQCENSSMPLTREEVECEELYKDSVYRQEDGRFVVTLPCKQDPEVLGESRSATLKRFDYLEKRLASNPIIKENYVKGMREYLELGHMKEISENSNYSGPVYYIPHHMVLNPSSTTTKQRIVFDASMKTSSGLSLNDILYCGPVVQPELLAILIRFRLHTYVMSADIVKMFRQILINPSQTPLQRILWRESVDSELKVYELKTLTFGERPAPYLATRCLNELALKYGENYPEAKDVILRDFYVDNLLSGFESLEVALEVQKQLRGLLDSAGFPLSKWSSNTPELLKHLDKSQIENKFQLSFDDEQMVKTLGMQWIPTDDTFRIWFANPNVAESKTKRQILAVIASIFDPMGLVGPVTVAAKCFMQQLWQISREELKSPNEDECEIPRERSKTKNVVQWDDPLPNNFLESWRKFASGLHYLNQVEIPRNVIPFSKIKCVEIHGFADASSSAYGAVMYLRVISEQGEVEVNLISSKSKVAPLKQLSIARLELCAALLLAELVHKISEIIKHTKQLNRIRLWSDSKVTLSWIGSSSNRWNVFVAHRVSKIQTLTKECVWDYVESAQNPADILSRGTNPKELPKNQLWFHGPSWLRDSNEPWSEVSEYRPNFGKNQDRKSTSTVLSFQILHRRSELFDLVNLPATGKYSVEMLGNQGLMKLIRITSLIIRFRLNCQAYFPKAYGPPKLYEIHLAKITLIKLSQLEFFSKEIKCLKAGKPLPSNSSIISLSPFIDKNDLLVVGGRLEDSNLSFEQRHPILLHHSHKLTDLIVLHEHLAHLHAGPKLLKSVLRRKYWIVRMNDSISKNIRKCHVCTRFKAKTIQESMANLPKSRVIPSKPFQTTGVDYAGPFKVIGKGGKHKVFIKAYIAVFVCFSTKAIHLELVSDLTTATFLAALRRFISRRGIPLEIHSDNGTTFVGAKNEVEKLKEFFRKNHAEIEAFAVTQGMQWHFIPPQAPHFGGLWEAGVKSTKAHISKVLIDRTLNFEEYATLSTQIEACLNSRPLTPESMDPNDLNALTPGHFLIGGPISALPSEFFLETPENRVKHWQLVQRMTQLFWKRWSLEYLNTLQPRYKWHNEKNETNIHDLVLIKEDNLPPTHWRLGRILELHPGRDGRVRVATVKTSVGVIKRPCVKLIPLPKV